MIKGTSLGAATNLNGEYFILNIPPGTYDVTASMIGFGSVTVEGTVVMVDLTANLYACGKVLVRCIFCTVSTAVGE